MSPEEAPIEGIRHSLAHLLAATVIEMYPGAKNAIGPAIENGFYQDFDTPAPIGEDELPKIEAKMREKLKTWAEFERREVSADEAREQFAWNPYKVELIDELAAQGDKAITFYTSGDFIDLCRGGHVDDARKINPKGFKLTKVSGAYWRGDQNKQQLQRIYGVAFATEEELKEYLRRVEEAKQRDHRKLGKELDLYTSATLIGAGLPLFTPRGTILRDKINELAQSYRAQNGYEKVWIPHIAKIDTYKTSGHFEKFPELLRFTSTESGDELALKPVNCPHHTQIFAGRPRSYKELPVKYMETTTVYRDEKSGELGGLNRVRSITQDDSHVFCTDDQVEGIFSELIESAQHMYELLGMKLSLRLSFRDDADNYLGEPEVWDRAQQAIQSLAEKFNLEHEIGIGEAAIYGPKMDFMATDALGRKTQLATVQLDYAMPERFGLEYTAEDGSKRQPIMIHCALLGSIERFLSIFIEHTGGWFPLWAAPEQVRILTINDTVLDYVAEIEALLTDTVLMQPIKYNEVRFTTDNRNESLGKKIREAAAWKIPVQLIVGPKDKEAREVSVRTQGAEEKVALSELAHYLATL